MRCVSFIAFISAMLLASAIAQNGLRDIPNTDPQAQLDSFSVIEGASINLFASDPVISNPVHMNWDQRGRLWVVSSPLYPHIQPGQEESDQIVILEDTTGDGVADKHTVFADNLHIPTAVLPGDGGVYVANSIEILFLRDTDGDDVADERHVVLSGFGTEDTHHLVHTFRWGPEGMMWMNQSIYIHTHLETPYGVRRLLGGGMWHYRTETRRAEVFMKGLVNPWGHAFDKWGQSFMTDGAGGQGINYVFPRSVFATSPGASRILTGLNPGQPKHCGVEPLTGRHLPNELQEVLAAPDFRGHRINLFRLTDNGSAYTSTQIDDLVSSTHRAFRPIDIKMGPDGAIYIADWYNPIIQHGEVDFRDPRRDHKHGRIWRISFDGRDLLEKPNLAESSDEQLIAALGSEEGWTRQLATVELRTRDRDAMEKAIRNQVRTRSSEIDYLRDVWALQAIQRFQPADADQLLASKNHKLRAGALRALYYRAEEHSNALEVAKEAVSDSHPHVRLWGVSLLAQLDSPDTVKIALTALNGIEVDEFLDFAVWSISREHADRWIGLTENGNPFESVQHLLFAARALNKPVAVSTIIKALQDGEFSSDGDLTNVADWISKVGNAEHLNSIFEYALRENATKSQQIIVLAALRSAGQLRKLQPAGDKGRLSRFLQSDDQSLFASAAGLAGLWKLESARVGLKQAFIEAPKNQARARSALDGLVSLGGPTSAQLFETIAKNETSDFLTRSLAVIGRTRMAPSPGAKLALEVLRNAPDGKDPHGIFNAFLATKQGPGALAGALKGQTLPQAVALAGMQKASSAATKPQGLVKALQAAGEIKPMKTALAPAEMESMMQRVAEKGNPHKGEEIYRRAQLQCIVCHAIGGAGGVIGPDLVSIGSSAPVDYLVDSLLQPSVKIKEGYHTTLVTLKNGQAFAGAIAREDANEIVIRDAVGNENRLAKAEVASNQISPVSLMPPGLTASLREDEFVDLVRFLSELGKDGDFKTPSNRFVRQWQMLSPHERTRDDIGHYGRKIFAEDFDGYVWLPLYSTVSGELPAVEALDVVGRGRNRYAVTRTFLDVKKPGMIKLKVTGKLADLDLFHGGKEIKLPEHGTEAILDLPIKKAGPQKLTLVGLKAYGLDRYSMELLDDASVVDFIAIKDFQ